MLQYALSIRGLSKFFCAGVSGCSVRVRALDRVDLRVRCGEIVAVVGPAGAGKTTLLLCASRLLSPDRGLVESVSGRLYLIDDAILTSDVRHVERLASTLRRRAQSHAAVVVTSRIPQLIGAATRAFRLTHGCLSPWSDPPVAVGAAHVAECTLG